MANDHQKLNRMTSYLAARCCAVVARASRDPLYAAYRSFALNRGFLPIGSVMGARVELIIYLGEVSEFVSMTREPSSGSAPCLTYCLDSIIAGFGIG